MNSARRYFLAVLALAFGLLLIGCGQTRWYPTDPRLAPPAASNLTNDDSWSVVVNVDTTTITASAASRRFR